MERERLLYTLFMLAVEDEPFNLEGLITTDELRFTLLFVFSFFLIMSFMMLVQINHTVTDFFRGEGKKVLLCCGICQTPLEFQSFFLYMKYLCAHE